MNDRKIFDLDLERCVGCFACTVACMDQNDTNAEDEDAFRNVILVGSKHSVTGTVSYISIACLHCEDAPCIVGCPTGALQKNEEGMTIADPSLCIGCHSCLMACPFGAPRFGSDGRIKKCDGCAERVKSGLIPACVRVCPTKALIYDTAENIEKQRKTKTIKKLLKQREK